MRAGFLAAHIEKGRKFDGAFTILIDRFTGMIGIFLVALLMLPFAWNSIAGVKGIIETFIRILLAGSVCGILAAFVVFGHKKLEHFRLYRAMKALADRITKLGFEPGLWVAPLIVEPHARIAQLDPDMLAKAENGCPALCWSCMKRNGFILDPTVERSQRFITEMFERFVSWGYRYFKLDFLGGVLNARQFTDRSVPRGKLMDLAVGTARKTVAGRARLLGCNYLFCGGPGPGRPATTANQRKRQRTRGKRRGKSPARQLNIKRAHQ